MRPRDYVPYSHNKTQTFAYNLIREVYRFNQYNSIAPHNQT